jgi:hypothetical protein
MQLLRIYHTLTSQSTRTATAPSKWDDLSASHQLDLLCVMSEIYLTTKEAMQQLRLNPIQYQRVLNLLDHPKKLESDQRTCLANLQAETNNLLRTWGLDEDETSAMASADGNELLQRYLPEADVEHYIFSTTTELAKAKTYLESCGHQAGLLDHWKSLLDDYGNNRTENGRMSLSSQSPIHEAETERLGQLFESEIPKTGVTFASGPWPPTEPIPFYQTYLYNYTVISENVPSGPGLGLLGTGSRITSSDRPVYRQAERSEPSGPDDSAPASTGPSRTYLVPPNAVDHIPSSQTLDPPTSFLYPVSPNGSPTPQVPAKLDRRRVAPHHSLIAHSPSMLRNARKAAMPRYQSLRPADTTTRPDDARDGPSGSGTAIKKKRATGPRKKTVVSSSTNLSTDDATDNNVPPTESALRRPTQVSTAPAPAPITDNESAESIDTGTGSGKIGQQQQKQGDK